MIDLSKYGWDDNCSIEESKEQMISEISSLKVNIDIFSQTIEKNKIWKKTYEKLLSKRERILEELEKN